MPVKHIDIVHHTHTDFGYTDHPHTVRKLLAGYVGQALDYADKTKGAGPARFYWTCEALNPVLDWFSQAGRKRRAAFAEACERGQIEVTALPYNISAYLNDDEWDKMFRWIGGKTWDRLGIETAMQNDVNGFPVAAALRAVRKGVKYLWMGPNRYNAAPPMPTPGAFAWKNDGEKIFVWLNNIYCDGFSLFNKNWRQGPLPLASDLRYRPPDSFDIWRTDSESMKRSHETCINRIAEIEGGGGSATTEGPTQNAVQGGYPHDRLIVSVTSHYRIDNDPPFLGLAAFVAKWNEMGYKPSLRLTTAKTALRDMEREIGAAIPELSGEWTDWWANGAMASPREMSATREAKRLLKTAASPVFGKPGRKYRNLREDVLTNLCMFEEHSFSSWDAAAKPYSALSRGSDAEKCVLAYRALFDAKELLADRARHDFERLEEGVYLVNASDGPAAGYVDFPVNCLRGGEWKSVQSESGDKRPLEYLPGETNFAKPGPGDLGPENASRTFADATPGQTARFWSGELPPRSRTRFTLSREECNETDGGRGPEIITDGEGWPVNAVYGGGPALFKGIGGFLSLEAKGDAPRWTIKETFQTESEGKRIGLINENLVATRAEYGKCLRTEYAHTAEFYQTFSHKALEWGSRKLTVYKNGARARLEVAINRKLDLDPFVFYVETELPETCSEPLLYMAGREYRPGDGQLPGCCRDYFTTDQAVRYSTGDGEYLWVSEDAPLLSFGAPMHCRRTNSGPENANKILSIIYDNTWDTGFSACSDGIFRYAYEISHRKGEDRLSVPCAPIPIVKLRDGI